MPEVFMPGTNEEIFAPAATFSAQVGTASKKTFDSMYAMPKFLKENFLFSDKTRVLFEDEYTQEEFENIIKNELNHGRPVMVGGVEWRSANGGGGHFYIINGYNSKNEFFTDYSFNDNFWHKLSDFNYGISQDIIVYMEPDLHGKTLTLDYPKGGEYIQKESEIEIQWKSTNVNTLKIEYTTDGGKTYITITENVTASTGKYSWTCPSTISDKYKIRISDTEDGNIYSKSQVFDAIDHIEFSFEYPIRNTSFQKGTTQPVYWKSAGIAAIKLEYSTDKQTWHLLSDSTSGRSGNVLIQVPEGEADSIVLKATDLNNSSNTYISDFLQLTNEYGFGGPYTVDENTILLMHFENNILNSGDKQYLPNETTPIGTYHANYANNLGRSFRVINEGAADAIHILNSANLDMGTDWTMEGWANVSSINGERTAYPLIINKWEAFNINASGKHFRAEVSFVNGTKVNFNCPEEYQLDNWYHFALISDEKTGKIYFYIHDAQHNLIYENSKSFPSGSNGEIAGSEYLLTIGGLGGGSNLEFDGFLDEIRIVKHSELSNYSEPQEYQELPFFDDFEETISSDATFQKWTTENNVGWNYWHIIPGGGINGSQCMRFEKTGIDQEDWLITLPIDCSNAAKIEISFNELHNGDGSKPALLYTTAYNGNSAQSVWTEINYSLGQNADVWNNINNLIIDNPGNVVYFAFKYTSTPSSELYLLLDNFKVEEYDPTPQHQLAGTSEHFNFYTNMPENLNYYLDIKDGLEAEFKKLNSIWNRPGQAKVYENDAKIDVYYSLKENQPGLQGYIDSWRCGFYLTNGAAIYLTPLLTDEQTSYYNNLEGEAVHTFSKMALRRRMARDDGQINALPSYFGEGFGLYEIGYRPNRDSIISFLNAHTGDLDQNSINDISDITSTSKKDIIVSYVEGQILISLGYYYCYPDYGSFPPRWNQFLKYFYKANDVERIELNGQSENFDIYCSSRDTMYVDSMLVWLERTRDFYKTSYEMEFNNRFNMCVLYDEQTGMDITGYDNFNGGSGGLNISPHNFYDGIEGYPWLLAHEFGHVFNDYMYYDFPFGFYHEGMANFSGYKLYNADWMESKYKIKNVFDYYQNTYSRYPALEEFETNPEYRIDPYFFGLQFIRYLESIGTLINIREFFNAGIDFTVYGKTRDEIHEGYINYLLKLLNGELNTLSLPFFDDFEETILNDATFQKWTTENNVGWNYWHIIPWGGVGNGQCMRFEKSGVDQSDWLITLPINSSEADKLKISFNEYHNGNGLKPTLLYTTDYNGNSTLSDWTEINYSLGQNKDEWNTIKDLAIDINADIIYFAFKYESTPSSELYLLLDNFKVEDYYTAINDIFISESDFKIYPNPVTSESAIHIKMQSSGKVNLSIYNAQGQEIACLINDEMMAGEHKFPIKNLHLSKGIYFCTLYTDKEIKTEKIIIK